MNSMADVAINLLKTITSQDLANYGGIWNTLDYIDYEASEVVDPSRSSVIVFLDWSSIEIDADSKEWVIRG